MEQKEKSEEEISKADNYVTVYLKDPELKAWAKKYAEKEFNSSLSQLIATFLVQLESGDFGVRKIGTGLYIYPKKEKE